MTLAAPNPATSIGPSFSDVIQLPRRTRGRTGETRTRILSIKTACHDHRRQLPIVGRYFVVRSCQRYFSKEYAVRVTSVPDHRATCRVTVQLRTPVMHLNCQSFVAVAAASSSRLPQIVLAAFLLTTCFMAQPTDGRPLVRHRREVISVILGDISSLSNPCDSVPPASGSTTSCSPDESVRLYAQRAKETLQALQNKLDPTPHSDLSLTPEISQPTLTAEMTNQQKLRELYRSLVHHAAHLHTIRQQSKNYTDEYRRVIVDIMHVQCSLQCAAEVTSADATSYANTAAAGESYSAADNSRQTMRDLAIAQYTITLLDKLINLVAG